MAFRPIVFPIAVAGTLLAAMSLAQAETIHLTVPLDGATEVPSVATQGKGSADVVIDTASREIRYTVTYSGLSGPVSAAHFHGPATVGTNAPVAVPLAKGPSPMTGQVTMTEAQMADLLSGKDYINLHTEAHPGGEIRGYVTR